MLGNAELVVHQNPRFEDKFASLNVEWEPGDIDGTVTHRQFEPRYPDTRAVMSNPHVVGLRRNLVHFGSLRTNMNQLYLCLYRHMALTRCLKV